MLNKTQQEIIENWNKAKETQVSVVAITYNHIKFIEKALDSFLMQETNFPFEIIVHDDASTDGTSDIVRNYQKKYPDIIKPIIQTENQYSKHRGIALKDVFDNIKTKYIALCECDDNWTDETKLQKQFDFMEENPEYSVCYHNAIVVDENENFIKNYRGKKEKDLTQEELIKVKHLFHTSTFFFRNIITPLPIEYVYLFGGASFIFSLIGNYGKGKYYTNIKPSIRRKHKNGITNTNNDRRIADYSLDKLLIYQYYYRIGEKDIASYYLNLAFRTLIKYISFSALIINILFKIIEKAKKVTKLYEKIS